MNETRKVEIEEDVLGQNQMQANLNKEYFKERNIKCINIVSSPGSGKTSLLEQTLMKLKDINNICVIEGDQHTSNDADRIKATGVKALQINTENGCHLDAIMVKDAVNQMDIPNGSLLFIENVGNLVCPAMFHLGENIRVVVISVTEGDDKPLKYPYMFQSADVCIINKIDLLPYLKSDVSKIKSNALEVNPKLLFFEVSATTGDGIGRWLDFIKI